MLSEQKVKHTLRKYLLGFVFPDVWNVNEMAVLSKNSLRDDRVDMGMPVNKIAKGLSCCDHCRNPAFAIDLQLKDFADSVISRTAELAEEFTIVTKVDSQSFGDSEHPLSMWNLCEYIFIETMCKQQGSFLITRGAT